MSLIFLYSYDVYLMQSKPVSVHSELSPMVFSGAFLQKSVAAYTNQLETIKRFMGCPFKWSAMMMGNA